MTLLQKPSLWLASVLRGWKKMACRKQTSLLSALTRSLKSYSPDIGYLSSENSCLVFLGIGQKIASRGRYFNFIASSVPPKSKKQEWSFGLPCSISEGTLNSSGPIKSQSRHGSHVYGFVWLKMREMVREADIFSHNQHPVPLCLELFCFQTSSYLIPELGCNKVDPQSDAMGVGVCGYGRLSYPDPSHPVCCKN